MRRQAAWGGGLGGWTDVWSIERGRAQSHMGCRGRNYPSSIVALQCSHDFRFRHRVSAGALTTMHRRFTRDRELCLCVRALSSTWLGTRGFFFSWTISDISVWTENAFYFCFIDADLLVRDDAWNGLMSMMMRKWFLCDRDTCERWKIGYVWV